tara:strand:+ start:335 stop:706 length:372 start_codon:yes stop_codon:yes gene_type:complete
MNNLTTPMAILISGVLISLVLLLTLGSSPDTFRDKCTYYLDGKANDTMTVSYTTGNFLQQKMIIYDAFELTDVTTRSGYAEGTHYSSSGAKSIITYSKAYGSIIVEQFGVNNKNKQLTKYICR